jgi:hypothetical protein
MAVDDAERTGVTRPPAARPLSLADGALPGASRGYVLPGLAIGARLDQG